MQKYNVLTLLAADSAGSRLKWVGRKYTCFLHCRIYTAALLRSQGGQDFPHTFSSTSFLFSRIQAFPWYSIGLKTLYLTRIKQYAPGDHSFTIVCQQCVAQLTQSPFCLPALRPTDYSLPVVCQQCGPAGHSRPVMFISSVAQLTQSPFCLSAV